jgi:hypothetical protein
MRPARCIAALAALVAGCADPTPPLPAPTTCESLAPCAIVTFVWDSRPDTMHVMVTHAPTIAAAHAYVLNGSGPAIPSGPIVRGPGSDPRLPFHYLPDAVRLVDVAIELCDGQLMKTEAQLDDYFLGVTGNPNATRALFCPWGARPVQVEESP